MTSSDPQVPWTDEQWALVRQAVQKEASRSRVAATFLPLYGPLPGDADFVRNERLKYDWASPPPSPLPKGWPQTMSVDDRTVIPLTTLQVRVYLRGAQMADSKLTSALEMFRRAANVLARLEDAIVFRGQKGENEGPDPNDIEVLPAIWTVRGGEKWGGLLANLPFAKRAPVTKTLDFGQDLIQQVSEKIGKLEGKGHFGPFAVVLGQTLFGDAQAASAALVLPSDRIIPFLGGGPLLRSSTLPDEEGIVVALGAAPVELVVATDVSVSFLQVTTDPHFVFRVFEKIALRIKESGAIEHLKRQKPVPAAPIAPAAGGPTPPVPAAPIAPADGGPTPPVPTAPIAPADGGPTPPVPAAPTAPIPGGSSNSGAGELTTSGVNNSKPSTR